MLCYFCLPAICLGNDSLLLLSLALETESSPHPGSWGWAATVSPAWSVTILQLRGQSDWFGDEIHRVLFQELTQVLAETRPPRITGAVKRGKLEFFCLLCHI